jgi:uncharacterized membrane protein YfcA
MLGNINWAIFAVIVVGVVPGARLGAILALRARARTLRLAVAAFLFTVSAAYGTFELLSELRSGS